MEISLENLYVDIGTERVKSGQLPKSRKSLLLSFPVLNGQFVKIYHAHTDVDMFMAFSSLCLLSFGRRSGRNILRSICRVMGILFFHLLHFYG